jgi:hypothetical protein
MAVEQKIVLSITATRNKQSAHSATEAARNQQPVL